MQNETASQWREVDIALAGPDVANPYTDIDAWVTFTHSSGRQLRRPAGYLPAGGDGAGTEPQVRRAAARSKTGCVRSSDRHPTGPSPQ